MIESVVRAFVYIHILPLLADNHKNKATHMQRNTRMDAKHKLTEEQACASASGQNDREAAADTTPAG